MPIEIIPLATCPFCDSQNHGGQILFDAITCEAVNGTADLTDEEAYARLVRYNNAKPGNKLCDHLVHMLVDVAYGPLRSDELVHEWEACCAWLNPLVPELDPDDGLCDLLRDHDFCAFASPWLAARYRISHFSERWRGRNSDKTRQQFFDVTGHAIFADDIPVFFKDLTRLELTYRELWNHQWRVGDRKMEATESSALTDRELAEAQREVEEAFDRAAQEARSSRPRIRRRK